MGTGAVTLVTADWVADRIDSDGICLLDARSPVRYLSGHLENAVNAPWDAIRDNEGHLRSSGDLAAWLGAAGLDDRRSPVIYDGADGRHGAMLAWILLYLGRADVHVMDVFFETWRVQGREVFYRPVKPVARAFEWRENPAVRIDRDDVLLDSAPRIDFRSSDEFSGRIDPDGRPGRIPGARHLASQELGGEGGHLLASVERLKEIVTARGLKPGSRVIAYCHSGPRAALGFLALRLAGWDPVLYDGSYADWARSGLPVENTQAGS